MGNNRPAISLQGVAKRFGHLTALQEIDVEVPEGASLTLFGPNGAGKTTLLRLVATLSKPSGGRVLIRGADTLREPEQVRADIGLISHQTLLYEDLTARENLLFYGRMYGLPDLEHCSAVALDAVGLAGRGHDRVRGFSRGMKQRLAIARATLHGPSILLLDEPFTGLDASARAMLSDLLVDLHLEGRTVLLVTHDLERGLALAGRFIILKGGRIVAEGTTADVSLEEMSTRYKTVISRPR